MSTRRELSEGWHAGRAALVTHVVAREPRNPMPSPAHEESVPQVQFSMRVSFDDYNALTALAQRTGRTKTELLHEALGYLFSKRGQNVGNIVNQLQRIDLAEQRRVRDHET